MRKAQSSKSKKTTKRTTIPVAVSTKRKNPSPNIRSTNGSTIVRHSEFVSDVTSSAVADTFSAISLAVNPGNTIAFPWLSTLALSYETYRFLDLSFHFEPAVATTTTGVVQLGIDYDASDPIPASKMELMSNHRSVRSSAYSACSLTVDKKDASTFGERRFIRYGGLTTAYDPKLYDVGRVIIATSGFATPSLTTGELYVTYTVELYTPQLDYANRATSDSALLTFTGESKVSPLGSSYAISGGINIARISGTQLQLAAPGEYLFYVQSSGTGLAGNVTLSSTTASVEALASVANGTDVTLITLYRVKSSRPSELFTFSAAATTTFTDLTIRVSKYGYALG